MNWKNKLMQILALLIARLFWNPLFITKDAREIIKSHFGMEQNIFLADVQYKTVTRDLVQRFLDVDPLDMEKWRKESFDCDDFAFQLFARFKYVFRGAAFGVCWIVNPPHAVNFFIDSSFKVWMVEPQTDDIFKKRRDWQIWFVVM